MLKRYRKMYVNGLRRRANWIEKHPWLIVLPIFSTVLHTHRRWYGAKTKDPQYPQYKEWMDAHVFEPVRAWYEAVVADQRARHVPDHLNVDVLRDELTRLRAENAETTNQIVDRISRIRAQGGDVRIPEHLRERLRRKIEDAPGGIEKTLLASLRDLVEDA